MNHIFWLCKPSIAGRPGPNQQPWDLESLRDSGISAVLSVNHGEGSHQSLMDEVLSVRPIAFSAQGWMEFCFEVLSEYQVQANIADPANR